MGQFLQRLINRSGSSGQLQPEETSTSPADEPGGPDTDATNPGLRKSLKQPLQTTASSNKKALATSKSIPSSPKFPPKPESEAESRGFELGGKQAIDGARLVIQPVDAISESKSTSSGTRRVYKVIRVAPSNFLSVSKQIHSPPVKSPSSQQQQSQQQSQPQQRQKSNNKQADN